ncbi:MAG: PD-(D/E)XK nuclease family protein [Oligoflexia bacterium]|nr:PD-(D/E)XK nuclease family protein [Oligoflexia bacterium]
MSDIIKTVEECYNRELLKIQQDELSFIKYIETSLLPQFSKLKPKKAHLQELIKIVCNLAEKEMVKYKFDEKDICDEIRNSLGVILSSMYRSDIDEIKEKMSVFDFKNNNNPLTTIIDILFPFSESKREVRHTKLLAFYLNPYGKHDLKYRLLTPFLEYMKRKGINFSNDNESFESRKKINVYSEYRVDLKSDQRDYCRLDVLIRQANEKSIFIEAKVDSNAGYRQREDYEAVAKFKSNDFGRTFFIWLTSEGNKDELFDKWIGLAWSELVGILYACVDGLTETPHILYLKFWISSILHTFYGNDVIDMNSLDEIRDRNQYKSIKNFLTGYLGTKEILK